MKTINDFNIRLFFFLILMFIIISFLKTFLERIEANKLKSIYDKSITLHCENKDSYIHVKKGDGSFIKEDYIYKDNKKFMILDCSR